MNLKFGENLRKYRLNAGLTQEQLAEIFGVSLQSVSRWESSQKASYPDIELLCSIARHFGVSVDMLLGNNDSPNIDWSEYDRMESPTEKYKFLTEHKKRNPEDHDIDWQFREYNNKKFVTAVHDSYFFVEKGLWFTPKLLWEILCEPVKEHPDNEILLSVYHRIKALK